MAVINKKITRMRDFEAIAQPEGQTNLATFIRTYKNAMAAAQIDYTEHEQIHGVIRRMADKDLYNYCMKATVDYPTSWDALISMAPRFRTLDARSKPKGRDRLFVAAETQTIKISTINKDSGRYEKVEQKMWKSLTQQQQDDFKSKRRAQYKADRQKKAAAETTDKALVTNGEFSSADWERDCDSEQVFLCGVISLLE